MQQSSELYARRCHFQPGAFASQTLEGTRSLPSHSVFTSPIWGSSMEMLQNLIAPCATIERGRDPGDHTTTLGARLPTVASPATRRLREPGEPTRFQHASPGPQQHGRHALLLLRALERRVHHALPPARCGWADGGEAGPSDARWYAHVGQDSIRAASFGQALPALAGRVPHTLVRVHEPLPSFARLHSSFPLVQ